VEKIKVEDFLIQCLDNVLKRYRKENYKRDIVKDSQKKEIVELYKEYKSINKVVKKLRWGHGTVAKLVKDEIVKLKQNKNG